MNVCFGGRPDCRTREAEIWDSGMAQAKKYHRMGGNHHSSNGGCYQEKSESGTFVTLGRKAGGTTVMVPGHDLVIVMQW